MTLTEKKNSKVYC